MDRSGNRAEKLDFSADMGYSPSRVYFARIHRCAMPRDALVDCCRVGKSFPHVRRCGAVRIARVRPKHEKRTRDLRELYVYVYVCVCACLCVHGKQHAGLGYRPMPAIDRRLGHGTQPMRAR